MKKFYATQILAIFLTLILSDSYSQAPLSVPYQAVARNSSGNLIQSQTVALRFTIHSGAAAGLIVYQETQSVTTSALGLFSVNIGQGIPVSTYGSFSAINWASAPKFMQVEIDITGGTNYLDMGTQQMMSVPYALYAETSGHALGSVTYAGAWDAGNNAPLLQSSAGTKGFYYVVIASGNHDLNGVTDWQVGDWAIYNGNAWEKVDNTDSQTDASSVSYSPTSGISSTNVQDAIEELSNDARNPSNIDQDATHRFVTDAEKSTWNNKADKTVPATSGNFAGLDASGDLTDSGKRPSDYLDKTNTSPYTPSSDYHPATKKYVDDADNTKADKIVPAVSGNFALLNGSGNLSDGGLKTASNIGFVQSPGISSANVQDAIEEVDARFGDLINSYIHKTDDGLTIYLPPGGSRKRLGIGDAQPSAPLGVKGETGGDDRMISLKSSDASQEWNINLNPTASNVTGFSIDDASSGSSSSRFFIDHSGQGNVGIGTVFPNARLTVSGSNVNGYAAMSIVNSSSGHNGWLMGQLNDNVTAIKNGAFSILENTGTALTERITVLPSSNVGVNEELPYATLHVTRPASDAQEPIALSENTGVLLLGPIDNKNLAFDSHQIQARTGSYPGGGSTLSFVASELNLQPLGGDLIIHNNLTSNDRVSISGDGKVGIGKTPSEKLDVNGAITIGDSYSTTPSNGTIRWTGNDFEGRKSGTWVSLTTTSANDGFVPGATDVIYYEPASGNPKVGIGVVSPTAALHVEENAAVTSHVATARIESKSTNSNGAGDFTRIGLEISNSFNWSSNALSKDIGLYIKQVSGQAGRESNLAAVINGNTVIGDLVSGNNIVGTGGRNVLAIQNGDEPSSQAGSSLSSGGGIQIYSHTDAVGTSVFTVMNGDGTIIKLHRASALSSVNNSVISTSSYGTTEATVIENLRTRINELESKLQAMGLLQ